jgi:site-specific recombinase XerD
MHPARHTIYAWPIRQVMGASLVIIGKSLDHKHASTTQIYDRLDLDPVRQSLERATAAMLDVAGVKTEAKVVEFKKDFNK